jgi:hypothetical protein
MVRKYQNLSGFLALCTLVLSLSCTSDSGGPPDDPGDPLLIAKTQFNNGDYSTWSTGHNVPNPMRVIVTRGGRPVPGITVTWATEPESGILTPVIGTTGADGISTARWTLGVTAGQNYGTASVDSAQGSPVRFTANVIPNSFVDLRYVQGDLQSGQVGTVLPLPLIVLVVDQFNNPSSQAPVEWIITSGSATVSPTLSVDNPGGEATTTVTLGNTPGPVVVVARLPGGDTGPRVTFNLTATP